MSQNEPTQFTHAYHKELPLDAAAHIWTRWSHISSWKDWDGSLAGTQTESDSIVLGKSFHVIPKLAVNPIPVTVVSAVDGLHFTTASSGPIGLMAFGHALIMNADKQTLTVEHSICVVPNDANFFQAKIWDNLKNDLTNSVESLASIIEKDYSS